MKRTPLARNTPMRQRSRKRQAYMASQERAEAVQHMLAVKALPCIACGAAPPSEAHHVTGDGKPRDDLRVIPLCPACHRGPNGYHLAKRAWVARHGRDCDLLPRVAEMLGAQG
jgi:hypothetical protein